MHRLVLVALFAGVLFHQTAAFAATVKAAKPAAPLKLAQIDVEPIDDEAEDEIDNVVNDAPSEIDEEMQESDPIEQTDSLPSKAETITPAEEPVEEEEEVAAPTPTEQPAPTAKSTAIKTDPDSEVIFDWSKHQNETHVKHPFAEKGLTTITRKKDYIYKVDESPQTRGVGLRVGQYLPLNLSNPDADGPGSSFEDNYDETSNPMIMVDYEWQMWRSAIGKFGIRAGSGLYIAQGNGHFVEGPNAERNLIPREIITFWATPHMLGVVYRMQMWDKQLFIPYGEGGGYAITFGEFRDDSKPPKWGGALAGYFAGGVALNLTYFDNLARIALDREYGINRVYFTAEYRAVIGFTRFDFTSDLVNAGFLAEF